MLGQRLAIPLANGKSNVGSLLANQGEANEQNYNAQRWLPAMAQHNNYGWPNAELPIVRPSAVGN